ncbi:MAG: hypothetical protein CBB60_002280 [Armatimonadetes bacterium Cent15-Ar3]|nr:MAG: hypothetical protein CBB60_002280 [Armatimonadetes bacterium Cent15-Ar3]
MGSVVRAALALVVVSFVVGCGSSEPEQAPAAPQATVAGTAPASGEQAPGPSTAPAAPPKGAPEGAGADGTLPEDRL